MVASRPQLIIDFIDFQLDVLHPENALNTWLGVNGQTDIKNLMNGINPHKTWQFFLSRLFDLYALQSILYVILLIVTVTTAFLLVFTILVPMLLHQLLVFKEFGKMEPDLHFD